jgi:hypothetical protein
MRIFLLALALAPALSAHAQQPTPQPTPALPPAGSNWRHVQALPVGASINVKARKSHAGCKLKSVDADSLTCTRGKDLVFQRTDIVSIKIPRRGRSALVGGGLGAGVGALIGAATGSSSCSGQAFCFNILSRGDLAAIGAVAVGFVGAVVGGATDFTRSTVYQAP